MIIIHRYTNQIDNINLYMTLYPPTHSFLGTNHKTWVSHNGYPNQMPHWNMTNQNSSKIPNKTSSRHEFDRQWNFLYQSDSQLFLFQSGILNSKTLCSLSSPSSSPSTYIKGYQLLECHISYLSIFYFRIAYLMWHISKFSVKYIL